MVGQSTGGITSLEWPAIILWADRFYSETVVEFVKLPYEYSGRGRKPRPNYAPVTFQQCSLEDYELQMIMHMSQEYSTEYNNASDPKRECPREIEDVEVVQEDKDAEADMFLAAFLEANSK